MSGDLFVTLGTTAAVTAGAMGALWLLSLRLKDASIVDIFWGPGFALIAWSAWAIGVGGTRATVAAGLVSLWGLRLGSYLYLRNHGKGEDYRYVAMRRRHGDRFPLVSLYTVFGLQAVVMWVVSLPVQAVQASAPAALGLLDGLGVALFAVGFLFESVGDLQLARFKADPSNEGKVMDRGLWAWTRHPNYFGDCTLWWGLGCFAFAAGAWWAAIGPIVMSVFLLRISGVTLLERGLKRRKPEYEDYIRRTSSFFPMPPRG